MLQQSCFRKDEDGRFGLFAIALTCGIINAGSKYVLSKIEGKDYTFQDGYNNFEEPKEVVNINAPMCGLHDDRHYFKNAEE